MGWPPERTAETLTTLDFDSADGTWLRVRGMATAPVHSTDSIESTNTGNEADATAKIAAKRHALEQLRASGFRLVAMLRWSTSSWSAKTRPAPVQLPLDQREAYERCRALAHTYADLIDAWEIENEPDISFVPENPETFAAFYKACSLGILHGRVENEALRSKGLKVSGLNVAINEQPLPHKHDVGEADGSPFASDSAPLSAFQVSAFSFQGADGAPASSDSDSGSISAFQVSAFSFHGADGAPGAPVNSDSTPLSAFQVSAFSSHGADGAPGAPATSDSASLSAFQVSAFSFQGADGAPGAPVASDSGSLSAFQVSAFSFHGAGSAVDDLQTVHDGAGAASAIMHSPLALPPGPYWDELVANDTLSYTEAFNYHYYGFAKDFRGVRDAWINALAEAFGQRGSQKSPVLKSKSQDEENAGPGNAELQLGPTSPNATRKDETSKRSPTVTLPHRLTGELAPGERDHPQTRPLDLQTFDLETPSGRAALPLFLTEYGYGLLDRFDRNTVEGRERQAEWFRQVLPSVSDGTITGAMAFYMPPYYERGVNEFGLLAEALPPAESKSRKVAGLKVSKTAPSDRLKVETPTSGPTGPDGERALPQTRPSDLKTLGPLDKKTSSHSDARSPGRGTDRGSARPSDLKTFRLLDPAALSPVVLDFIAGDKTQTVKRYNGHLLQRVIKGGTTSVSSASTFSASQVSAFQLFPEIASVSEGDFSLILYNFSDEPVTGTLTVSLENGRVGASLAEDRPAPSDQPRATSPQQPKPPEPLPYKRPDTPRSSLRPLPDPDWPNASTPTFTTPSGKTYAITPALEKLRSAAAAYTAQTEAGEQKSEASAQSTDDTPSSVLHSTVSSPPPRAEFRSQVSGFSPSAPLRPPSSAQPDLQTGFVSNPITLAPMERREIKLTATLPNQEFRPHRLWAVWQSAAQSAKSTKKFIGADDNTTEVASDIKTFRPLDFETVESRLATNLFPAPAAFRSVTVDALDFDAESAATTRTEFFNQTLATDESPLQPSTTASRWLTTPGVDVEETPFGWHITINDLPSEPLRPAIAELALPPHWRISAGTALNFRYRLILPQPSDPANTMQSSVQSNQATAPNRYEEFELNLRDKHGTLWGVWPRLNARVTFQSYLEPSENFTPMFYSRPPTANSDSSISDSETGALTHQLSTDQVQSLVLLFRPRVLPTTIELVRPQWVQLEPK